MDSLSIYKNCVQLANEMAVLISYYEKYQSCISVNCLNAQLNEALAKLSDAHHLMMARIIIKKAGDDVVLNDGYDEVLMPGQMSNQLKLHRDEIITMLDALSLPNKSKYLHQIETCCNDIRLLVNRMQLMLRSSQQIFQTVERKSA